LQFGNFQWALKTSCVCNILCTYRIRSEAHSNYRCSLQKWRAFICVRRCSSFCNSDRALLQKSKRTLKGSFLQHFSRKDRKLFLHHTVLILKQTAETEHGMSFTSSNVHETFPFTNTPGESLQPIVGMSPVRTQRLLIDLYDN